MFSFAHGEQTVSLLDVRLTPTGRRLAKATAEEEAGPAPASERRQDLERKAWGKARFRGHALGDWRDAEEKIEGASVAECRLCGQEARVDAGARKAAQIGGPATERDCGGWAANPKNSECQKAMEYAAALGLDRLAGLLREKRGERGYREVVAEMALQDLGEVGASDMSRAEHGRRASEDLYHRLCRWVGMMPGRIMAEEARTKEPDSGEIRSDAMVGRRPAERKGGA